MSKVDQDGFIYVSHKRNKKKKNVSTSRNLVSFKCSPKQQESSEYTNIDISKIKVLSKDFEKSDFFKGCIEILANMLSNWKTEKEAESLENQFNTLEISKVTDLVCYGLGSFSSCIIARFQLAFLCALRKYLDVANPSIYDPVFSNEEKAFLKEIGFDVLKVNEKAKRTVNYKTIFFMPHCDLPLYNNLLWSNWNVDSISNLIIIGNNFSNYERLLTSVFQKRGSYVKEIVPFVTEIKLPKFGHNDIFNDMSFHYFSHKSVIKIPLSVWKNNEEPVYELDEFTNYS